MWELQKQGYKPQTVQSHGQILRLLSQLCNLSNPETVRIYLARSKISDGRKENVTNVYSKYSRFAGIAFEKPRYHRTDTLPFIPQDSELRDVINAARSIRHSTVLQLMYETAGRVGEITALEFKDFDFQRRIVRLRPEKQSKAREARISDKVIAMIQQVFGRYPVPFPNAPAIKKHLWRTTHLLAKLHSNPRYLMIHAHTFRHYVACKLYWQTKDILYVKNFLGHRSITSTMKYLQLVEFKDENQYVCKAVTTAEEAVKLIEAGFTFETMINEVSLFKKRK